MFEMNDLTVRCGSCAFRQANYLKKNEEPKRESLHALTKALFKDKNALCVLMTPLSLSAA
jgi:hypothetical protein